MAQPFNALYGGYGAFELKQKYQRNMFMGTMFTVAMVAVIVLGVWVYKVLTEVETVYVQQTVIKTIADLGPPPTVTKVKPQVQIASAQKVAPKVGIPKPVADDEVLDEDIVIATRDELAEIIQQTDEILLDDADGDIVVDIDDDEFMPTPDQFVPVEIQAEMIVEAPLDYPRLAKSAGMEADVWVKALVDKDGNVRQAMVAKSSGSKAGFDEAAVDQAYKCKYKPAIQNGRPVAVWVTYKVEFALTDAN